MDETGISRAASKSDCGGENGLEEREDSYEICDEDLNVAVMKLTASSPTSRPCIVPMLNVVE